MRKTVYLHIGLPKTGTSHVQATLQANRGLLDAHGAHYLQAGQHPLFHDNGNHLLAVSLMRERWEDISLQLDYREVEGVWSAVRAEIDRSKARAFIASSEWFAFDVHEPAQLQQLKTELSGYDVGIVIVLRDVVDYVNSAYAQSVRDGFIGDLSDYLDEAWYSLNWAVLVARWGAAFGRNNVMAFSFETLRERGIVSALLNGVFGRDFGIVESRSRNHSLPEEATMLMRIVNASSVDDCEKVVFRNLLKAFFEKHQHLSRPARYLGTETERLLRRNCAWPHITKVG